MSVTHDIKSHLNKTGIFLEQKVHVSLDRHPKFVSRREHPFSSMNLINETVPEIIEGAIDVFAVANIKEDTLLCLCIECKKANPEQKHWVFEMRTTGSEIYPFVYYDNKIGELNYEKNIFFPSLNYPGMDHFDRAIQAFQFKTKSGALSRNMTEMAHHSLKQANQAVKAIAPSPNEVFKVLSSGPKNILFLPVVVTTANLWTTKYNPQDVSWKTGELKASKIGLESRDWVHFEFPLPVNLKLKDKDAKEYEKRPTFVVKANKFSTFVTGLVKDCERYILDFVGANNDS